MLLALTLFSANGAGAADYYVALDGNDVTGDGSAARPWRTIQFALDSVVGAQAEQHTIWIGPGRFTEVLFLDDDDRFEHLTGAGFDLTVIDGEGQDHTIMLLACEGNRIQNLAVTGGLADSGQYAAGGGIFCAAANISLLNLDIYENVAYNHGGVFFGATGVGELAYCWIHDNQAERQAGGLGMSGDVLHVHHNLIENNSANEGGGFNVFQTANLLFENNIVRGNFAQQSGGAGRMYASQSALIGNRFENNRSAVAAAGLFIFESDPVIAHNLIANNSEGASGVVCTDAFLDGGEFTHNTVVGNVSGLRLIQNAAATGHTIRIKHNIFWDNGDDLFLQLGLQPFDFSYNLIQDTGDENEGPGVVHDDPLFQQPGADDYHVQPGSPVIDGGDPAADFCQEPQPNGCVANLGMYGNTSEAELSPVETCVPVHTCPPTPTLSPTPAPTSTCTPEVTATSTASPTPTAPSPTPVPTAELAPRLQLSLNQSQFSGGDAFLLYCTMANFTASQVDGQFVALLQVFDQFFFYPVWDQAFRSTEYSFGRGSSVRLTLLSATLPDDLPTGGPYSFHGALLDSGMTGLLTPVSTVTFFFGW